MAEDQSDGNKLHTHSDIPDILHSSRPPSVSSATGERPTSRLGSAGAPLNPRSPLPPISRSENDNLGGGRRGTPRRDQGEDGFVELDGASSKSVSFASESPSREIFKMKAFDGRECTFATIGIQTDLAGIDTEFGTKRMTKGIRSDTNLKISSDRTGKSQLSLESKEEVVPAADDASGLSVPAYPSPSRADEYGIPMLELSSDSSDFSDSDDSITSSARQEREQKRKKKSERRRQEVDTLASVGPPQILQYQRESEKEQVLIEPPVDQFGDVEKMMEGECEFCKQPIKPFPSIEDQDNKPPEELYCCDQYKEFIQLMLTHPIIAQRQAETRMIDIKPHPPYGSIKAREAAKERAAERLREREMARQQAAMHSMGGGGGGGGGANFYNSTHHQHASKQNSRAHTDRPVGHRNDATSSEGTMSYRNTFQSMSAAHHDLTQEPPNEVNVQLHVTYRDRIPMAAAGRDLKSMADREILTMENYEVARQMKTINYQLSSMRCLEEGWTLKPPEELDGDGEDEIFEPEPVEPPWAEGKGKKSHQKGLVTKFYPDGRKYIILFPDGTGNIFYHSGNVALTISSTSKGLFTYIAQSDSSQTGSVIAVFSPDGHAATYFNHGGIRIHLDQLGGIEHDNGGARKRRWLWKEQVQHVHAPPLQPITFAITPNMALRIMSQDNVALTFNDQNRRCRFQVGTKLKLVDPEQTSTHFFSLETYDADQMFREEVKTRTESLLHKVANLLKFPNSPKLAKLPGMSYMTSRLQKLEKIKEDQQAARGSRDLGSKASVVVN